MRLSNRLRSIHYKVVEDIHVILVHKWYMVYSFDKFEVSRKFVEDLQQMKNDVVDSIFREIRLGRIGL
jgi:hypothetical protein